MHSRPGSSISHKANLNGVSYPKYRQYAYSVDGLHARYLLIKKFLEQDFMSHHDCENNILISLELHNIPATIVNLAKMHGISLSPTTNQINQVCFDLVNDKDQDDYKGIVLGSISQLQARPGGTQDRQTSGVQCWLCDGPHTFHECNQF
jgi:hypothetical protein